MNDISSLSSSLYTPQVSGQSPIAGVSGQDADGDNDGGSGVRRGGGRGEFASAVFQALSQAGITLPTPGSSTGGSASGGQDSDGDNDSGAQSASSSSAQQALHAFMHSLFQALNQTGAAQSSSVSNNDGSQSGSSGAVHHHAGNRQQFAADAQQLLQSLTSGSRTGNPASSSLESSFQNLLQALGTSPTSGSAQPTLQSFLQSLVQNLGGSAPQPSGNLVQAQA